MRIVLDTNVLVSGIISPGAPRHLIDRAKAQQFDFYTSEILLAELLDVLSRTKFNARLARAGLTPRGIVEELRCLAHLVAVSSRPPRVVATDPDDDHVLACAIAAKAHLIVSGDSDLLAMEQYQEIQIIAPAEALKHITVS